MSPQISVKTPPRSKDMSKDSRKANVANQPGKYKRAFSNLFERNDSKARNLFTSAKILQLPISDRAIFRDIRTFMSVQLEKD